jgi:integrase
MGTVRKIKNKSGKISWQIDYIDPAGERIRQTFKKKKDADMELGKLVSLIGEKRYMDVKKEYRTTFGELAAKYQENFKNQASYKTAKRFFIAEFKQYFGIDRLLADITYLDLETYLNHLKESRVQHGAIAKTATVNRKMSCLRHMLKKAVHWDLASETPFDKGQSLFLKESNQRLRYLDEDEIDRLLDACSTKVIEFPNSKTRLSQMTRKDSHYLREVVECAINTGMRKGEILSLEWDQIRGGFIYLTKTKTLNPRQIPINDDLDALFKRIRKRRGLGSKHVFTFQGKPITRVHSSFDAALKRANITDFRFHDLRHTFASHFVMRGGDLKALQEILGHTTLTMTMKYTHLAPGHKQQAVNLLNGLTGRHPTQMSDYVRFSNVANSDG